LFADFRSTQAVATIFNTTLYITPKDNDADFGEVYTLLITGDPVPFKAL
jgi:hypothetical protein